MTQDFLDRAQDEVFRLEEQDRTLAQEEHRIREQRELLAEQLVRIRTAMDIYRQLMEVPPATPPTQEQQREERSEDSIPLQGYSEPSGL